MIQAESAEGGLNESELVAICILLIFARHETTVNLIGNGTLALPRNPDHWRDLVAEPGLERSAVEELLRYDAPIQSTEWQAFEDVEIGGVRVAGGTQVSFMFGSANRDEAVFGDAERLDIRRNDGRIMSFGMGIHFCLGAPLARMEGEIAFATLARKFPNLALVSDNPKWRPGAAFHGPRSCSREWGGRVLFVYRRGRSRPAPGEVRDADLAHACQPDHGVERDSELNVLEESLVRAAAGQCGMVLLNGEAGVGKSRLAREAVRQGQARGFELLIGECSERDLDFPFAPFVDALRQRMVATPEDPAMLLGPQGSELAGLLPEYPGLVAPCIARFELSPEQGKRRLFEGIVAFVRTGAAEMPLLLVLEDLHWADPTSLELLELLPRRLQTSRLLILVPSRTDESRPELARSLAALHRARMLTVLRVEPLSERGVGIVLKSMLTAPPPHALVTTVFARTGGNPFLIEEMVASGHQPGSWWLSEVVIPARVRDVVTRQLEGLDQATIRVVDLAAVAGERVLFDFLQAVCKLDREEFLARLHTLIERRILVEDRSNGRSSIAFRHALTRDALLDRLLLPERRSLHRLVAEMLEVLLGNPPPPGAVGELGYHLHAAEEWDKTIDYAARAGEAARAVHANAEAMAHFKRALDAATVLNHRLRARIHCRCGQALSFQASARRCDRPESPPPGPDTLPMRPGPFLAWHL